MTDAIYRVWYGAFDQAAALQLATVLVGLTVGTCSRWSGCCAGGRAITARSCAARPSRPARLHG